MGDSPTEWEWPVSATSRPNGLVSARCLDWPARRANATAIAPIDVSRGAESWGCQATTGIPAPPDAGPHPSVRSARPGVVLRWAHEPRRHARHAHAHADPRRSGIHTGGEECAMPAWLHGEWRLLHAYVPACSGPARASLSGKRDFKTRDEGTKTCLPNSISPLQRQSARTRPPPIGG
jgi:hypothetical protein